MSLWTSIRNTVQAVAGIAMPSIAPLMSQGAQQMISGAPMPMPGAGVLSNINFPGISNAMAAPTIFSTAAAAAASIGRSGLSRIGNILYSAKGKILAVLVGGTRITPAKAKALAARVGMDAAAAALGISIVELAQMIMSDSESARRRTNRGISGANLRTTRRTMQKLHTINKYIAGACPPARRAPARARSCKG